MNCQGKRYREAVRRYTGSQSFCHLALSTQDLVLNQYVSHFTVLLACIMIISLLCATMCPAAQKIAGNKIERTFIIKQRPSCDREPGFTGKRVMEWNGIIATDRLLHLFCTAALCAPCYRLSEPFLILDHLATVRMLW